MKKQKVKSFFCILLYVLSGLLTVCFAVTFSIDWIGYAESFTSAPLYAILLVRVMEFLLPALLSLGAALLFQKLNK